MMFWLLLLISLCGGIGEPVWGHVGRVHNSGIATPWGFHVKKSWSVEGGNVVAVKSHAVKVCRLLRNACRCQWAWESLHWVLILSLWHKYFVLLSMAVNDIYVDLKKGEVVFLYMWWLGMRILFDSWALGSLFFFELFDYCLDVLCFILMLKITPSIKAT